MNSSRKHGSSRRAWSSRSLLIQLAIFLVQFATHLSLVLEVYVFHDNNSTQFLTGSEINNSKIVVYVHHTKDVTNLVNTAVRQNSTDQPCRFVIDPKTSPSSAAVCRLASSLELPLISPACPGKSLWNSPNINLTDVFGIENMKSEISNVAITKSITALGLDIRVIWESLHLESGRQAVMFIPNKTEELETALQRLGPGPGLVVLISSDEYRQLKNATKGSDTKWIIFGENGDEAMITNDGNSSVKYIDYTKINPDAKTLFNALVSLIEGLSDVQLATCKDLVMSVSQELNSTTSVQQFAQNPGKNQTEKQLIKVVTAHSPPFVIVSRGPNGTVYTGYSIDVWRIVADRMGLDYVFHDFNATGYGIVDENGKWTGVIRELIDGHADVAIGPVTVTSERSKVVEFSTPYYENVGIQLLMKDEVQKLSIFVFTNVFEWKVWLAWLAILVFSALMVYSFHKIKATTLDKKYMQEWNFINSFWFAITTFSLAGPEESPRMASCRVFVAGFWFFSQIIMAAFTANLAAFLTNTRLNTPIDSIDDLVAQSRYKYTVEAGGRVQSYFSSMAFIEQEFYTIWRQFSLEPSPALDIGLYPIWEYPLSDKYTEVWNAMQAKGLSHNLDNSVQEILDGRLALFLETPIVKYIMGQKCGLRTAGSAFSLKPYAFAFPKQSFLKEDVSSTILALQSEITLSELKAKWWHEDVSCSVADDLHGLPLSTTGGIFIVMMVGLGLSALSLFIECIIIRTRWRFKFTSNIPCEDNTTNKKPV